MGFFEKCTTCNKNIGLFSKSNECCNCNKTICDKCIKKYDLKDFCGTPKFFTRYLKDVEVIATEDIHGRYQFVMYQICKNCQDSLGMDKWVEEFNYAKEHAHVINVIKGSSTTFDSKSGGFFKLKIIGSRLDLIDSFKISAYLQGYDFIYELFYEKNYEGFGDWYGTCKAGRNTNKK